MKRKKWQPEQVLITSQEVEDSLSYASHMKWPFCPSPLNAAFVVFQAINKMIDDNKINN